MFIISLHYLQPMTEVEKHLDAHRTFLDDCYKQHYFIASGPKVPRTGGIILARIKDRASLEALIELDPFKIHGVASYEIIEFMPNRGLPESLEP
ncbi:MAG: YciI family protein [Gammaproteobacteria bacterium]|nr:YciI family protein [Gammaproteobacteria bacterium]